MRLHEKSSRKFQPKSLKLARAANALFAIRCSYSSDFCNAFTESLPLHTMRCPDSIVSKSPTALNYAKSNHPTLKTAPMVAQAFFKSAKTSQNLLKQHNVRSSMPLSNSVLCDSDTLPAFPTAQGLLSPEMVMRMELMTVRGRDKAVDTFLEKYRKEGPMSCLPMLSDKNILPQLTEAMRETIA